MITMAIFGCSDEDNLSPINPNPGNMNPPEDLGVWEELAKMPSSRKEIANTTVQIDGKIYVMGGVARSGDISDLLEIYDITNDTWIKGANIPHKVWRASAAESNGKIYLFGGYQSLGPFPFSPSNKVFEYDPGTDTWEEKTSMSIARGASAAVSKGSSIHVLGGANSNALSRHDIYNAIQDSWVSASPMAETRSGLTAVNFFGSIYVFGGYQLINGGVASKRTVEKFSSGNWSLVSSLLAPRHGIDADVLGNMIYVTGGSAGGSFTCMQYDPANDSWKDLESMLLPVSFMGTVAHDGFIYSIGGGRTNLNRTDAISANRRFTPPQEN